MLQTVIFREQAPVSLRANLVRSSIFSRLSFTATLRFEPVHPEHETEELHMTTINLRDFYPWCKEDIFVEITEEILEAMKPPTASRRHTGGAHTVTSCSIPLTATTGLKMMFYTMSLAGGNLHQRRNNARAFRRYKTTHRDTTAANRLLLYFAHYAKSSLHTFFRIFQTLSPKLLTTVINVSF